MRPPHYPVEMWLCPPCACWCHSRDNDLITSSFDLPPLLSFIFILRVEYCSKTFLTCIHIQTCIKLSLLLLIIQIAPITILGCSIRDQHSFQTLSHAPMCQFTVPCAPMLSLEIHSPQITWKYNALFHLILSISEHSIGDTPPTISGQLLVQMFITKEEEQALGIPERNTVDLEKREQNS